MKILKVVSGMLAVIFWFAAIQISKAYVQRRLPYEPKEGRIYLWNQHGVIGHLTKIEQNLIYGLMIAAGVAFLVCVVGFLYEKLR